MVCCPAPISATSPRRWSRTRGVVSRITTAHTTTRVDRRMWSGRACWRTAVTRVWPAPSDSRCPAADSVIRAVCPWSGRPLRRTGCGHGATSSPTASSTPRYAAPTGWTRYGGRPGHDPVRSSSGSAPHRPPRATSSLDAGRSPTICAARPPRPIRTAGTGRRCNGCSPIGIFAAITQRRPGRSPTGSPPTRPTHRRTHNATPACTRSTCARNTADSAGNSRSTPASRPIP